MKLSSLLILLAFILALPAHASAQKKSDAAREPDDEDFVLERRVNADPNVVVTLCLSSGGVVVRGWDRNEVRARADDAGNLRLNAVGAQPAGRVEVLVSNRKGSELVPGDCGMTGGLELAVPRGATVNLQVRSGDVEVSDVAEARVENFSGHVELRRVARSAEVSCMSGDISLADSGGRVRLRTVSGSVDVRNVSTTGAGDEFEATSTSGDVSLQGIRHAQVKGATVSGSVTYAGTLARRGVYDFKTISGDVTMELPADASFSLRARVVVSGEIVTDFPITTMPGPAPPPSVPTPPGSKKPPRPPDHGQTRLDGTVGAGDAVINMTSFSGTLYLKKR